RCTWFCRLLGADGVVDADDNADVVVDGVVVVVVVAAAAPDPDDRVAADDVPEDVLPDDVLVDDPLADGAPTDDASVPDFAFGAALPLRLRPLVESKPVEPAPKAGWYWKFCISPKREVSAFFAAAPFGR